MASHGKAKIFICFTLLLVPLSPGIGRAACYDRMTPTYEDISLVEITRCQPDNDEYPCYFALLGPSGGENGYLLAYRFNNLKGRYAASDPGLWKQVIAALKQADFLKLRVLESRSIIVHFDGPVNQITVEQCNAYFSIHPSSYDLDSAAYRRFIALVERLTQISSGLKWQQKSDIVKINDIFGHFLP